MGDERYRPVDCGFHDELLARATRKEPVEVVYLDSSGAEVRAFDSIEDVFSRNKAEWVRLGSGAEIRLDKLVRVDGVAAPAVSGGVERLVDSLRAPEPEFGPHPFWFWNDDLDEDELLRQLRAFCEAGAGGVIIHPRTGLSRRVGYLTGEYFRLVKRVVAECARLGMRVVLYDECSYPSGSACGLVAAENPRYAARALALARKVIEGPTLEYWRPRLGRSLEDRLVSVSVARLVSEDGEAPRIDPGTLRRLAPQERGLVRIEAGEGRWLAMACIDTPSGGRIRGAFAEQDDGMALAPPAGDLMNPEAVGTFVRVTHDAYYAHLKEYFGSTIVALFTDEPNPLGRGARRDARPFTGGFDVWFEQYLKEEHGELLAAIGGDAGAWLPALWLDFGPLTGAFREAYGRAVHRRVVDVFYGAQAEWCRAHGIRLTGHPSESNDMASLVAFDWPGQDMVWRWVVPGDATGVRGTHSVAPKAATSAARAGRKRRIAAELLGAYGWRLSLDEVKWLVDWHLVRGNNLLFPHAFFYSVREGRAYESEPDLFLHNAWRPYLAHLNRYIARVSKLLTDCEHVCDVAVFGDGRALPWRAAESLYESQIDFLYIDEAALTSAEVDERERVLRVGEQAYRVVVIDGVAVPSGPAGERLESFRRVGGLVIDWEEASRKVDAGAWGTGSGAVLTERVRAASAACVLPAQPVPGLRVMWVRKGGVEVFIFSNEGEEALRTGVALPIAGAESLSGTGLTRAAWYDPLRDRAVDAAMKRRRDGRFEVEVALERRELRLLIVDPSRAAAAEAASGAMAAGPGAPVELKGPWSVRTVDGSPVDVPAPGDWTWVRELERFSGTLCYETTVELGAAPAGVEVDLGDVGEIAEIRVNGVEAGLCLWAPYRAATDGRLWRAGVNRLEVRVTNSSANAYEGAMRPSGLLGPVTLVVAP